LIGEATSSENTQQLKRPTQGMASIRVPVIRQMEILRVRQESLYEAAEFHGYTVDGDT